MDNELAKLHVPVVLDQSKLKQGMDSIKSQLSQFADSASRNFGSKFSAGIGGSLRAGMSGIRNMLTGIFQGMGQSIFGTISSALMMPFRSFGASIANAVDAEAIERKFKAVFAELTDVTEQWSRDFAAAMGRSVTDIQATLSRFQDTLVPIGFDRKQAAETSKILTQLSSDLAAAEGITENEAADRIVSGMVGNHEALRRFGVIITETSLNAKLLEMGIKGGSKAATEQQKVLARLNIVLAGTKDAQGTAGRAAGSFGREFGALQSIVRDFSATIGRMFTPALAEITKFASGGVSKLKAGFGDTVSLGKKLGESVANALEKLEPLREKILASLGTMGDTLTELVESITDVFNDPDKFEQAFRDMGDRLTTVAADVGVQIGTAMAGAIGPVLDKLMGKWFVEFYADLEQLRVDASGGDGAAARRDYMDKASGKSRMGGMSDEVIAKYGQRGITFDENGEASFGGKPLDLSKLGSLDDLPVGRLGPTAQATDAGNQSFADKLTTGIAGAVGKATEGVLVAGGFGAGRKGNEQIPLRSPTAIGVIPDQLALPAGKEKSLDELMPGREGGKGSFVGFAKNFFEMMTNPEKVQRDNGQSQVAFAGIEDIQRNIQQQLGGPEDKMKKDVEETKKLNAEQLEQLKKAPEAIGKAVSNAWSNFSAVLG